MWVNNYVNQRRFSALKVVSIKRLTEADGIRGVELLNRFAVNV